MLDASGDVDADGRACPQEVSDRQGMSCSVEMAWVSAWTLSQVEEDGGAENGEEDGAVDSGRGPEVDGKRRLMMVSDGLSRPGSMGMAWVTVGILSQVRKGGSTAEAVWYGCWASMWVSKCPACAC